MRPSKLRLPDRTDTTARSESLTTLETAAGSGPPLPIRLNPSSSRYSVSPARSRYSLTTLDPGASDVLTHGLTLSPRCTAFRASSPAPTITDGLDVLVQLVIAAITTCPLSSSVSVPSSRVSGTARCVWVATPPPSPAPAPAGAGAEVSPCEPGSPSAVGSL